MLLSPGTIAQLAAQQANTVTFADEGGQAVGVVTADRSPVPLRTGTGTGTATQPTGAGMATTATILLSFSKGAKLTAVATLNGVTTN